MPPALFGPLVIVASLASQELVPAPGLEPAHASQIAETPALETSGLKPGDHIKALTSQGEWIMGRFEGLRDDELVLSTRARAVVLHKEQLWEVRAKGHRPRPIVRYFLKACSSGPSCLLLFLCNRNSKTAPSTARRTTNVYASMKPPR